MTVPVPRAARGRPKAKLAFLRRFVLPLLVVLGLFSLAAALVGASLRAADERSAAETSTLHTMEVIVAAERLGTALADGQRGVRGFLLTGDDEFLEPYRSGRAEARRLGRRLVALTADNGSQQRRAVALNRAIADQFGYYDDSVAGVRAGRGDLVLASVRAGRGKALMDTARGMLARIVGEEERLLASRRIAAAAADRRARLTTYAIAGFGGLVLLGALALGVSALRNGQRVREAELRDAAAQRLRLSQQRFLTLVQATEAVVWHTNPQGAFAEPQPSWEAFTRQSFEEYAGWGWAGAIHPDDRDATTAEWAAALRDIRTFETEHRLRGSDGEYRTMLVRAVPVRGADGEVAEWVGLHTDISDRKRAEDELAAARDAAEAANTAKSQFIANMSHELRTPLSAIIGYAELLKEEVGDMGPAGEPAAQDLDKIEGSARHLLQLINGVLDISKIEAGKMEVDAEAFDVRQMVADVENTISSLVGKKGNRLEIAYAGEPGAMFSDQVKLRQCLLNLLSNAAKFTEGGLIRLSVARDGDRVAFEVTDTGIGMTPEQAGRLFERFAQADSSTTRRFGGTGLGLAITKAFAGMLGGAISVRSEPGRGTAFRLDLPADWRVPVARSVDANASPTAPAIDPDADLVLVVDDDPAQRDLLSRFLRREGFAVAAAVDGEEGLRLARELRPCAVLLDVMMPRLDGWSVLSSLKDDPATADIPVIMVTVVQERALGFSLGAADYLSKPVRWDRLKRAIDRHKQSVPAGVAVVVEHDPVTRAELKNALEADGWRVLEAADRHAALDVLAAHRPDLLVVDLQSPEESGLALLADLKARPDLADLPVIAMADAAADANPLADALVRGVDTVDDQETHQALLAELRRVVAESRGRALVGGSLGRKHG